jgi:MGT family glycosyltransferase
MAKLAFVNLPAHGHVNPTLPLVAELTRRGHEVTYFASAEFAERVERAGARFRCYPALSPAFSNPGPNLLVVGATLLEVSRAILPWLVEQLRAERFDAVIHDSMCPWGRFAARILGLPSICSTSTFAIHPAMLEGLQGRLEQLSTLAAAAPALLRAWTASRDLRRAWRATGTSIQDVFSNAGDLTLVYTSRAFQPRAELFDESFRFVGPSLPDAAPTDTLLDELDAREATGPLVYVSLGTLLNDRPAFFAACIEAFRRRRVRVVLAIGDRVDPVGFGTLPDDFWVRRTVPQLGVLRRAAAFVSHGGMNSVSESLVYGVPLVVWPQQDEQAMVGRRVESLGAGLVLSGTPSAGAIAGAVDRVLDEPGHRAAARDLGASLRAAGGPVAAADEVGQFLEGARRESARSRRQARALDPRPAGSR